MDPKHFTTDIINYRHEFRFEETSISYISHHVIKNKQEINGKK